MMIFVVGEWNGNVHQIHLHGQHFQVLKTGLPVYNADGTFNRTSDDLMCDGKYCNNVQWANSSWRNGQIPGLIEKSPILKDTISVPIGAYTVVRFKADNPGKGIRSIINLILGGI